MKILIVFNHPAPYKVALFNGLAKKHDVHVIFERASEKSRHKNFYNEQNYRFTTHPIRGIRFGDFNHFSFGVKRHIKRNNYDLIIMNGYSTLTEMIALNYLKRSGIHYAFYINGGIAKKESKLKTKIKRHYLGGAFAYFSPGKEASEYLMHYGVDEDLIHHYPYSTVYEKDITTYRMSQSAKQKFWESHDVTGENFTICVTSFIPRKNNLHLIKCWANIAPTHPLILVGSGPEERLYKKTIKELQIKNVYLLPFAHRDKLFNYLKHADNAVYLSNFDIYGHVINEALAHGLNVLTNNNMIASRTLIKHGINGLISENEEKTIAVIENLFTRDFYDEAILTARENTIEKSIRRHLQIIGELR